jgi:tetratricopeptide (TPR) repeat protein
MNYVPIFVRIEERQELKDLIGFISNDDKRTKVPLQDGSWMDYLPTKKIRLTVDSAEVVNSGTVRPENADMIVDEITWDVSQNALYRNDLMLLDIISTNNWERPIYFANPNSHAGVFNVDKYCHLEGIVYRLKPYVAPEFVSKVGGVDADRTYAILMGEDVRWGRLNEDDVVIDRESDRTLGIMKQNYLRLAQALADQGKTDSVIKVLDRGLEFFPGNKIPYDFYMLPWADNYFRAGDAETGKEVLTDIADRYREDLNYFASLDKNFIGYYNDQIQESLAVIQRCSQLARENNLDELSTELDEVMMSNINLFEMR